MIALCITLSDEMLSVGELISVYEVCVRDTAEVSQAQWRNCLCGAVDLV